MYVYEEDDDDYEEEVVGVEDWGMPNTDISTTLADDDDDDVLVSIYLAIVSVVIDEYSLLLTTILSFALLLNPGYYFPVRSLAKVPSLTTRAAIWYWLKVWVVR